MFKKLLLLIILIMLITNFYSCNDSKEKEKTIINNNTNLPVNYKLLKSSNDIYNLLFFAGAKHLVGINPETLEIESDAAFDTFINFGGVTSDYKIVIGDLGKDVGIWGKQLLVFDKDFTQLNRIDTLPNPLTIRVFDGFIFADSGGFYDNSYTAFSIYNTKDYNLVYRSKEIVNVIGNQDTLLYDGYFLVGVNPQEALNRKSHFLKISLDGKNKEAIYSYTDKYPFHYFKTLFYKDDLIIIYNNIFLIDVFNIKDNSLIQSINLKNNINELNNDEKANETPNNITSTYKVNDSKIVDDTLMLFIASTQNEIEMQKIVEIDLKTFNIKRITNIDLSISIKYSTLEYITNKNLFFKEYLSVFVFNLESGNFMKLFLIYIIYS